MCAVSGPKGLEGSAYGLLGWGFAERVDNTAAALEGDFRVETREGRRVWIPPRGGVGVEGCEWVGGSGLGRRGRREEWAAKWRAGRGKRAGQQKVRGSSKRQLVVREGRRAKAWMAWMGVVACVERGQGSIGMLVQCWILHVNNDAFVYEAKITDKDH